MKLKFLMLFLFCNIFYVYSQDSVNKYSFFHSKEYRLIDFTMENYKINFKNEKLESIEQLDTNSKIKFTFLDQIIYLGNKFSIEFKEKYLQINFLNNDSINKFKSIFLNYTTSTSLTFNNISIGNAFLMFNYNKDRLESIGFFFDSLAIKILINQDLVIYTFINPTTHNILNFEMNRKSNSIYFLGTDNILDSIRTRISFDKKSNKIKDITRFNINNISSNMYFTKYFFEVLAEYKNGRLKRRYRKKFNCNVLPFNVFSP